VRRELSKVTLLTRIRLGIVVALANVVDEDVNTTATIFQIGPHIKDFHFLKAAWNRFVEYSADKSRKVNRKLGVLDVSKGML
jgi:hypothetical protein